MNSVPQLDERRSKKLPVPDFRVLFDSVPGLYLVLLPDELNYTIVAVNQAYARATLTDPNEIIGRGLFEVFPDNPDDPQASGARNVRASLRQVLATKAPHTMAAQKYDIRRADSAGGGFEERYWSSVNSPVFGEKGEVQFVIRRVEDVQSLWKSQEQLRAIYDGTYEYIGLLAPDGTVLDCNRASLEFAGNTREDVIGQPFWETPWFAGTHGAPEAVRQGIARAAAGEFVRYEAPLRRPSGEVITFDFSLHPVHNERGEVIYLVPEGRNITEHKSVQKQADANLKQQWHTFDTALSHTPDFTYIFDLNGRFTYVNRALLSLWQKPLEEAVGKNFFELNYPPDLAGRLQQQIQQVVDTKQPIRDQTPFTGPTGETRHYDYIFVPILDANGQVEAVAGSTRDVTEQNRSAQQIEDDRRRWRELLLQTPAAIAVFRGPEHQFEWVNPEYTHLVGRSSEALLGKTLLQALPELEGQIYLNLLDRVYQTGEPFIGHESLARLDRGDGALEDIYVNFVYAATRNIAGEIDGIFAHVTDVTGMVLARKHIEESERQFRTLAETIPHLAWMANETGYISWYNRRWYDYTGTTLEEIEGWGWEKLHDPQLLPNVVAQWKAAIASGEPFEMVFPLRGADGTFRSFLTRVEPVKDNQGRVVRWFGTNTDITDQRKIEEELRRINRELEEFAFVASHDLQEPLRMVNIYTQLMLKTIGGENKTLNEYSGFVQQGVNRMEALIRDLLTFSRNVHAEELSIGTADLSASFNEALLVLKNRIEETKARIHVEALPLVRGETAQMAHVFQNILSNALKYRGNDVSPEIHVSAIRDRDHWIISVRDNGVGFEPQYAERIFGLFKRLHKDEYPGTGLGLAICKRIIERYGGRIWAEGRPGNGATFYFALPPVTLPLGEEIER